MDIKGSSWNSVSMLFFYARLKATECRNPANAANIYIQFRCNKVHLTVVLFTGKINNIFVDGISIRLLK